MRSSLRPKNFTSLKNYEKRNQIDHYLTQIKYRKKVEVDEEEFKKKFEKLDSKSIDEYLGIMLKGSPEQIAATLNSTGIKTTSKGIEEQTKKTDLDDVAKKLNMESITEFENNGKNYFKFKDKDGNIRITENIGDDSKELFTDILNNYNVTTGEDDKKNADEIFKFLNDYKLITIGMESSKNVSMDSIPPANKAIIEELKNKFPNKEIIYSVKEDIYVIKGENNEKDEILNIKSIEGRLQINKVEQKGYQNSESKKENEEYGEEGLLNELENDEELSKTIIDSEKSGVAEDITIGNIIKQMNEKGYKNDENSIRIAIELMKKVREKNKEEIGTLRTGGMHSGR